MPDALDDAISSGRPFALLARDGETVEVLAETDGLLFARHSQPYAWRGKVIGKIAGHEVLETRKGALLTD